MFDVIEGRHNMLYKANVSRKDQDIKALCTMNEVLELCPESPRLSEKSSKVMPCIFAINLYVTHKLEI